MNAKNGVFLKTGLFSAGAVLAVLAFGPSALANPVQIGFNGAGITGHASLTIETDTTVGDPAGAKLITDASGSFSDATLGIFNVPITGVMARNFATPDDVLDGDWQPGDPPFPVSFSELPVQGGTVVTYSELFYPGGSPQSCWDYPFAGGMLDTYGVMFTLDNGDRVDLWSDGSLFVPSNSPVWLTYGFAVIVPDTSPEGYGVADEHFGGVNAAVPEPKFLWAFGAGLLGLLAWRRSVEKKRVRVTR